MTVTFHGEFHFLYYPGLPICILTARRKFEGRRNVLTANVGGQSLVYVTTVILRLMVWWGFVSKAGF